MKTLDLVCLSEQYDLKEWFGQHFAADYPWINVLPPDEVANPSRIRHAMVWEPGREAFEPYPNLELVSCIGAGVDALLEHPGLNPQVSITRMINREQAQMMAGFASWFIVGWHRDIWGYLAQQQAQEWNVINFTPPSDFPVGILGYGTMGQALAESLRSFGYPVSAFVRTVKSEDTVRVVAGSEGLAEIARMSRAVVNLLPLTVATKGILSAGFFEKMRDDSILIQLGRGGHLIEKDLIEALDSGRPAMAALDVFSMEPLPSDHPLWRHERSVITPHAASAASPRATAAWVADGIARWERGETPQGLVDRRRGY